MLRVVPRNGTHKGLVRVIRRRLATESENVAPTAREPIVTPQKKGISFKRIFWLTTALTGTFYVGSIFFSFQNSGYYDFFSDRVPLGSSLLDFAESHGWDNLSVNSVKDKAKSLTGSASEKTEEAKSVASTAAKRLQESAHRAEERTKNAAVQAKEKISTRTAEARKTVTQTADKIRDRGDKAADKAGYLARDKAAQFVDGVDDVVHKAEAAIRGEYPSDVERSVQEVKEDAKRKAGAKPDDNHVYTSPLPIGFEPPPGYTKPKAKKPEHAPAAAAPSLKESKPLLPAAAVAEEKKTPLTLAELEEKLRIAERQLDEQARQYTLKVMELEMGAQDALDKQEYGFRQALLSERAKLVEQYGAKMEEELGVQRDLIEERLKQSLAEQSLALQRRWIREIKVLVESERGGRLSKLNELSTRLKELQNVAMDNASLLDASASAKALTSAVHVLRNASLSSSRKAPFREEVRVLRSLLPQPPDSDAESRAISSALDSLESSSAPDVGVEPLADLTAWFTTSVSPKAARMALVPSPADSSGGDGRPAGLLSHIASSLLSTLTFRRLDEGQIRNRAEGGGRDVLSVLARAEWYLKTAAAAAEGGAGERGGLEQAARELNQLPAGPSREICEDWMREARRRLEVGLVLDVIQAEATMESLKHVA